MPLRPDDLCIENPMKRTAWNVRLLVALFIMISYLWGYSRLAGMDELFFVRSSGGLRALGLVAELSLDKVMLQDVVQKMF